MKRKKLKIQRVTLDLTQEQLANNIGMSRQAINSIEGGKSIPKLSVAFRLAKFFGMKVEDLFDND